jgi:hypothetical protein
MLKNSTSAPLLPNGLLNAVPVRIQRSRQHKQVSPNGLPIVYVGRPGKWGNPYKESVWGRERALTNYRDFLETCIKTGALNVSELEGKNLSCWCSLKEKCHADILLEYVEGRHGI